MSSDGNSAWKRQMNKIPYQESRENHTLDEYGVEEENDKHQ